MRKSFGLAMSCAALMAAGSFLTTDAAGQAAKKKSTATKRKSDPLATERAMREMMNSGGAVGCAPSSLPERQRLAMQRYGAQPCNDGGVASATTPAPVVVSKPWLVGLWVSSTGSCVANDYTWRLRSNGSYDRPGDSGNWKLGSGAVIFIYRDTGGELVSGGQESSLPIRSNVIRVVRLANGRMQLGSVVLQRCSTNPDAPIKMQGY